MRTTLLTCCLSSSFTALCLAQPASLRLVEAPLIPGSFGDLHVSHISDDGVTVVGARSLFNPPDFSRQAVVWNLETGWDFPADLGHEQSDAFAASADGRVIAGRQYADGVTRAFVWTADAGTTVIGGLPASTDDEATAVSRNGRIVAGGGNSVIFTYSVLDSTTALLPPHPIGGAIRWVSDDGQEMAGASQSGAFRRDRNGTYTHLQWALPGGYAADGTTTGYYNTPSAPRWRPFVWNGGEPIFLGGLNELPESVSWGIDVAIGGAAVVGGTREYIPGVPQRMWYWSAATGTVSIEALLRDAGLAVGSLTINETLAISDDGLRITGTGWRVNTGASVYWVATLPPPCAADIARTGGLPGHDGVLDNNDFIVFIDAFFEQSPTADRGGPGGEPLPDGQFDNNDFIVYISQFFAGC